MNYDLCSGTCLKKSGIYSVAMFHNTQIRTLFVVKNVFAVNEEIEPRS